eukprot:2317112-Amphidinium_carterae.1
MHTGHHWEEGRWAHHLLPYDHGLHVFNVYGYSSDKPRAPELNRELCLELFAAVAALGNRMIFILGDWNFAPDDYPIGLWQGGQVNRPLSNVTFTSPQGEVQTDWVLCSKALLPACGMEEATEKKPDHWAIKLDFDLEFVSQGYMGQRSYETAERTDPLVVAVEYQKQRDLHLARWSTALMSHDVDLLWQLWYASSLTLEPAHSSSGLPPFLGEIPPTVEAQYAALDAWLTGKKKKEQAERSASWRAYVKEAWERSPKKIYKWIRGNASVWDLAILNDDGYALSPDQIAQAVLQARSKLWQPGEATFPNKATSAEGHRPLPSGKSKGGRQMEHRKTSTAP